MSLLSDVIKKMRSLGGGGEVEEERLEVDDDVTTDKVLRGLRRQRRVQEEEIEKAQLRKDVAEFNRNRSRQHLWGIKDDAKPPEGMVSKKRVGNILKQKNVMIGGSNVFREDRKRSMIRRDGKIKRIKNLIIMNYRKRRGGVI